MFLPFGDPDRNSLARIFNLRNLFPESSCWHQNTLMLGREIKKNEIIEIQIWFLIDFLVLRFHRGRPTFVIKLI